MISLADWSDYKPPRVLHKLASSTSDVLASYEQALRVTNTIYKLEHKPSALVVEE